MLINLSVSLLKMPRIHTRKIGSLGYKSSYSEEVLENAIQSVQSGRLLLRKASRNFGIPYGTLYNKVNGNHSKKVGGQIRLRKESENKIVASITTMSKWKIPLTGLEIRKLVKSYLDNGQARDRRLDIPLQFAGT